MVALMYYMYIQFRNIKWDLSDKLICKIYGSFRNVICNTMVLNL